VFDKRSMAEHPPAGAPTRPQRAVSVQQLVQHPV